MAFWIIDVTGAELWEIADPTAPGTVRQSRQLPSGPCGFPSGVAFDAAGHAWIANGRAGDGGDMWELADPDDAGYRHQSRRSAVGANESTGNVV